MDDFDFMKAFSGVDLLAVDAIGTVIGRGMAAAVKGMMEAGLSERQAATITSSVFREMFAAFLANASVREDS